MNLYDQLRFDRGQLNSRRQFLKSCVAGVGTAWLSSMGLGCSRKIGESGEVVMDHLEEALERGIAHYAPRAKRVIFLHMAGAPSQLELFDYKPELIQLDGKDCPKEFLEGQRFAFIQGIPKMLGSQYPFHQAGDNKQWVSDRLPFTERIIDELCIIRSMHTDQFNHAPALSLIHI